MPFVYITTSVPVDKMPPDFNLKAAEKFSEITGQPVAYIAVVVNAGADLSMCGTKEPSVVLVVCLVVSLFHSGSGGDVQGVLAGKEWSALSQGG